MNKFIVKVFGSEYNVKADRDGDYILRLAEIVDQKMKEINSLYPQGSTTQTAVLACLNLVDEYFQKKEAETEWICRRIGSLIEKLATIDEAPCGVRDCG